MSKTIKLFRATAKRVFQRNWAGYCPICEQKTRFFVRGPWFRDELFCARCSSIPRQRAMMRVIQELYPNWRELKIHESSPSKGGASEKISKECRSYVASQYLPLVPVGSEKDGVRSENLECQTFDDETFDLVLTQDVFEHIFNPDKAIAEIARTLKPGGAHIMSVPIVNKAKPSSRRATKIDNEIIYHDKAEYHGNPVDPGGSLVTIDWGYDIADYLHCHSGMPTSLFVIDDVSQGIRAEYIEIVVSRKSSVPSL